MNSWQLKVLRGRVRVRRELQARPRVPHFLQQLLCSRGSFGRGPWAKSLFVVQGHEWVALSRSGQRGTRGERQGCHSRKAAHPPFCAPLTPRFPVPPQTLPWVLPPPNVLWLLALLPWLTGTGLLGVFW